MGAVQVEPHALIWRRTAFVLLGAVALLAWPAVQRLREQPPPPPPTIHLAFAPPPGVEMGSGPDTLDAALAPDERTVAFVASAGGVSRLWLRPLDREQAAPVDGTEGARFPAWSANGDRIAFFAGDRLKALTVADGRVRDLAEAREPGGAAWLADGTLIFGGTAEGPLTALRGTTLTPITTLQPGDTRHVFPMPDGPSGFVYVAVRTDGRRVIRWVEADGRTHDLGATTGHAQLVDDLLLSVKDDALLVQRVDREAGALLGRAAPLALAVGVSASGRGLAAVGPTLALVAAPTPVARRLSWFDAQGRPAGTAGEPGDYLQVRLSPDDRFAAVTGRDPLLRTLDVSVLPLGPAGFPAKISRSLAADADPVWSPDGRRVLFRSLTGGLPDLFIRTAHAPEAPIEPLLRSELGETPTDWSPVPVAGGPVLFTAAAAETGLDVHQLDPATGAHRPLLQSSFDETDARWSPDGRWIAYVSDEPGSPDVYVMRVRDRAITRVSRAGGQKPRWAHDGAALYFVRGAEIMRSARQDGLDPPFATATPVLEAPGLVDLDVSRRDGRLIAVLPVTGAARPGVRAIRDWRTAALAATAPAGPRQ